MTVSNDPQRLKQPQVVDPKESDQEKAKSGEAQGKLEAGDKTEAEKAEGAQKEKDEPAAVYTQEPEKKEAPKACDSGQVADAKAAIAPKDVSGPKAVSIREGPNSGVFCQDTSWLKNRPSAEPDASAGAKVEGAPQSGQVAEVEEPADAQAAVQTETENGTKPIEVNLDQHGQPYSIKGADGQVTHIDSKRLAYEMFGTYKLPAIAPDLGGKTTKSFSDFSPEQQQQLQRALDPEVRAGRAIDEGYKPRSDKDSWVFKRDTEGQVIGVITHKGEELRFTEDQIKKLYPDYKMPRVHPDIGQGEPTLGSAATREEMELAVSAFERAEELRKVHGALTLGGESKGNPLS